MAVLDLLPCVDSEALAEARRRELQLPREIAASLGWSAVEAARSGRYRAEDGREVDWSALVAAALAARLSIPPDVPLPACSAPGTAAPTRVSVRNETTLAAGRALVRAGLRPLALNFANAVVPGGGVFQGARAQEETLCRSSALWVTLEGDPMYAAHRALDGDAATDWAVLSPDVPVFRGDDGTACDEPWLLSFLTCAAPRAPAVGQPRSGDLLQARIRRVLDVARAFGYDTLVLGAWGCGAFGNDAARTARDFRAALEEMAGEPFREVVFAIADWSPERRFLGPFRDAFQARS